MSNKQAQAKNKTSFSKIALFSSIALSFLCSCSKVNDADERTANQHKLDFGLGPKVKVVYWVKEVHKDEQIPPDALEEREVPRFSVPEHTISSASLAAGRKLRFAVFQGQLVDQRDLKGRGDVDLVLDEKARQKVNDLADKNGEKPSELVTRWITEKLSKNSK